MSGKAFLNTKIGPLYLRPDNIGNGGIVIDDGPTGELGIDALSEAEQDQFQLHGLPNDTPPASTQFVNVGATQAIVPLGKTAIVRTITQRFVQIQPTTALLTTLLVYLVKLNDGGLDNAALDVLDDPDLIVLP